MSDILKGSRPIIVLGMHRSGTSALTRVLNLLGLELGPYLMAPSKDNEKGYWEHNDIAALHDRVLTALGSSWSDTRPLPQQWWERDDMTLYRAELLSLVRRDFSNSPVWGFKDPRTCRLLPLWFPVFEEMGCRPSFVIIHRHPREVAASLERRDGFRMERSLLLWMEHVLEAERQTRTYKRAFVTYDQVLADWQGTAERIAAALDLSWPVGPSSVAGEVDRFLTLSLRHHAMGEDGLAGFPWAAAAHRAVVSAAQGEDADLASEFEAVRREFDRVAACLRPLSEDESAARVSKSNARREPRASAATAAAAGGGKQGYAVSIIIPVFNKLELTKKCLATVLKNTPSGRYEVIIIDNASTDGTGDYLRGLEGHNLTVVSNDNNCGFAMACNQGARASSAPYLLFLNNDTEPQPSWLEPLLDVLDRDPRVGAVGSKLLFPDQTIQHAGVVIIESRKTREDIVAVHLHYRKPSGLAEANRMQTYQALTAASLAIRRTVFDQAGGFDEGYWNGYEDVDLCFAIRLLGWELVYQPASVLIHHESQSGPERFSKTAANTIRLNRRWAGKIKPDMVIDEDGAMAAASDAIRLYQQPAVPHARSQDVRRGRTSIVILTWNQLRYTKESFESIIQNTKEDHEIIFVDNGSTDGTAKWLHQTVRDRSNCKLIENRTNLGFAKGCNQGIAAASGEYILLLNNDVVVTENWLGGLRECLDSGSSNGIVGPMTNNISGRQKVPDADYHEGRGLASYARAFRDRNRHRRIPTRRIVGFCMLFRRSLIDGIGLLDERFGSGNFEDDDLCLRAELLGFVNLIAGDVFIHHYGSRTFLGNRIDYGSAMERNGAIFRKKWSRADPSSSLGKKLNLLNAVDAARQQALAGDLDQAVQSILSGIQTSPDEALPYLAGAELLLEAKRFKDALETLEAMPPAGDEPKKLELTGYCLEGLSRLDEAQASADLALNHGQSAARALNLKGVLAFRRDERDEAAGWFRKAAAADPGFGEAWTNLGVLAWAAGKKEEALELFERGFVLSPTSGDIAASYQSAASAMKAFDRAERCAREALALYPKSRRLACMLIDLLMLQRRDQEALDELERTMALFAGLELLPVALELRERIGPRQPASGKERGAAISLCMIVKNEERHLARCLQSAKGAADEIIVVDTGSTDRTREIARAYGAKVIEFPWTGSFAEARNVSLSKASGAWILVLDADEVISARDIQLIREAVKKSGSRPSAWAFVTRNYVRSVLVEGWTANDGSYPEEAGTGWTPSVKVRLFPRDSRIRFENAVHELVEPSLARLKVRIRDVNVPIHHFGKLDEQNTAAKGEAYYLLGKKKLAEQGGDVDALSELAVQAGGLHKYDDAAELWARVIAQRPDSAKAHLNLSAACLELGRYDEALDASGRAMKLAPGMREAAYNHAVAALYTGNARGAVSFLDRLLAQAPDYAAATIMLDVARCCAGEQQKGREVFRILKAESAAAESFSQLVRKLRMAGRQDYAAALLERASDAGIVHPSLEGLRAECRSQAACS